MDFSIAYLAELFEEATENRDCAESLKEWQFWHDRSVELRKALATAEY